MSVYSELLRITVLEEDAHTKARAMPELVALVLMRRLDVHPGSDTGPADPADRLGASLAYDAALVAVCRRLGLPEGLTHSASVTTARAEAERLLASRLPSLQQILVNA